MTSPLELWRQDFGDAYHQRNQPTAKQVELVLASILGGIAPGSALEPGSGIGQNLEALSLLGWNPVLGVEPNQQARDTALSRGIPTVDGQIASLPVPDDAYDLVLTCGVLIHIPPSQISQAIAEVVRATDRYVLAIEYVWPVEEEREYRGLRDVLWVRPYAKLYQYQGLTLIGQGGTETGLYDGAEWCLLTK